MCFNNYIRPVRLRSLHFVFGMVLAISFGSGRARLVRFLGWRVLVHGGVWGQNSSHLEVTMKDIGGPLCSLYSINVDSQKS